MYTHYTDHMIMDTILMMISLRMLKKSDMSFPLSPIFPMQIPNVMKNPIKPKDTERWQKLHPNDFNYMHKFHIGIFSF